MHEDGPAATGWWRRPVGVCAGALVLALAAILAIAGAGGASRASAAPGAAATSAAPGGTTSPAEPGDEPDATATGIAPATTPAPPAAGVLPLRGSRLAASAPGETPRAASPQTASPEAAAPTRSGPAVQPTPAQQNAPAQQTAAPAAADQALVPGTPCTATARACVDVAGRRAWLLDGNRIVRGPVSVQTGDREDPTPKGTFSVQWKAEQYTSREYLTPMPYSVFFAPGGIAFHEGRQDTPSAGCVKLVHDDAKAWFDYLQVGDEVQVT